MDDPLTVRSDVKTFTEEYIVESDDDVNVMQRSSDHPTTLEGFGYKFNEFGQLRHITTGEAYEFNVRKNDPSYNQKRYEAIGDIITDYVYSLLETECGLKKLVIPLDADYDEPSTFIFHSDDAFTNKRIVVLIHGTGVVRAGQWARRLIINDSLNSGTQIPFIKRAKGLGYGVIVFNTNDNKVEQNGLTEKIRCCETAENHANYVWKNVIIRRTAAEHIAIIAHSYGGIVTVNMCLLYPESFLKRVFAIAFTDSPHSLVNQGLPHNMIDWFRKVGRNWVFSNLPLDTFLPTVDNLEMECYSAGTQRHDLTSWMSFASIYEFIDKKYQAALASSEL